MTPDERNPSIFLRKAEALAGSLAAEVSGRVTKVIGLVIESTALPAPVGSHCRIFQKTSGASIDAEIVGFKEERTLLMSFGEMRGVSPGDEVVCVTTEQTACVGDHLLGRVIDGNGRPIDGKGPIPTIERRSLYAKPPHPLRRQRVAEALSTGIRAVDGIVTTGRGQRLGIFSGSGVGKSVLLGMIARYTAAQVNVIALVGERGREVRDFIEKDLGEAGLKRSVVVVSTSERPPLERMRAAFLAATVAEYFRDKGLDVILMMDSVTRVALAQREIGLSVGEPPATKGYTPSVFSMLPKLLERSGRGETGTITGFYAVLVEADDLGEPISDAVRSILDGHIVLSRALAHKGHYPAIDVLESISRLMIDVVEPEHKRLAERVVATLSAYREAEDLINLGAYAAGANPEIDYAIKMLGPLNKYLRQGIGERSSLQEARDRLFELMGRKEEPAAAAPGPRAQARSRGAG